MSGRLTTHVLDTSIGRPAAGMKVQLWREEEEEFGTNTLLCEGITNADGRFNAPLLEEEQMEAGIYEIHFFAASYFSQQQTIVKQPAVFLERIPIRFQISDPNEHYHVPLLVAPGGYSTYRGS